MLRRKVGPLPSSRVSSSRNNRLQKNGCFETFFWPAPLSITRKRWPWAHLHETLSTQHKNPADPENAVVNRGAEKHRFFHFQFSLSDASTIY